MPGPYGGALPSASNLNPVAGVSRATAVTETNSIIALSTRVDRILTELSSHYTDTNAHDLASYTGSALPISGGGTGATTAAAARTALGTNSAANITTGTLAIAQGGTAAATAAAARTNLGTDNASNITSGTIASAARLGSGSAGTGFLVLADDLTWKSQANLTFSDQTASYTLVLADKDKVVGISNASANNLSVPTNASVPFAIGTAITVRQRGVGQTTIVAVTPATTTINVRGSANKLAGQWAYATLIKTGTDTWDLTGDLTA